MDNRQRGTPPAGYTFCASDGIRTDKGCRVFIREKKTDCNTYREVDIIPRTDNAEKAVRGKRGKRRRVTEPKQKDLNDKNARRYLVQLGNGNFGIGDLHVSCTYSKENLPGSVEEAEKTVGNYLRRIAYRRKKEGLPPLKYILVTEYGYKKDTEEIRRIHHHIIMNGGLSRDDVEMIWTKERINWKRAAQDGKYSGSIKKLGWVNADRLQMNENGIEGLCKYITKDPKGKKRWSSSRNLERPIEQPPADSKYTRKQVERLAKSPDCGKEFFERMFPDFRIAEIMPEYYENTGWHIYLKMWRKKPIRGQNGGERNGSKRGYKKKKAPPDGAKVH